MPAVVAARLTRRVCTPLPALPAALQVMSLIAYLMEKKQNFGPHLIIVPNAGLPCCWPGAGVLSSAVDIVQGTGTGSLI